MWCLILLGYMIVVTDHGYIRDSIYSENSFAHSYSNSDFPSIWAVKSDTKVLSSVMSSQQTSTIYYTSETTVRALYPLQSLNNDSLGPLSSSMRRDSTREAFELGRGYEDSEKGLERRLVKYVWVLVGITTLLVAAVALGFKLGRKSVNCKGKQSTVSTASSDEDLRSNASTAINSAEEVFRVQAGYEAYNSNPEETAAILATSAAPRLYEEVKELSVDCKHDRKASLVIETESISPIHIKPMKTIQNYSSEFITFEDFERDKNSLQDNYENSDSEDSYDSSETYEENRQTSIVPYKRNIREQNNGFNIPEEKKNDYIKEKIYIQPLKGHEKITEIKSEVRFERTENPRIYEKREKHFIRTTYQSTQEVENYFDNFEESDKRVLAVCGLKDHATDRVTLEAQPFSSPSISEGKFNQQPLSLECKVLESFSEGEDGADEIEFQRSVSKYSESIVARESVDPDFKELFEVLDDGNYSKQFVVEKLLGRGAFGAVYLVRSK